MNASEMGVRLLERNSAFKDRERPRYSGGHGTAGVKGVEGWMGTG